MEKLIKLNTNANINIQNDILNITSPEYIYIPLKPNSKIIPTKKEVKIGTPLIQNTNEIVTSPISGNIITIKKVMTINGKSKALEIKNDYKEIYIKDTKVKRNILTIKKDILDKALSLFQINLNNKTNFVLNCIDDEAYTLTQSFYMTGEYSKFLEVLDKLADIYNLNIYIALKASNNFSLNELVNYLGMYPSIKLEIVPDLYLLGNNEFLLKHLNLNNNESVVIKASAFYHLSNFLKTGRLKSEQLITVSGDNIKKSMVIKTKIGTPLNFILKEFKIESEALYYVNGLMGGLSINPDNFIITDDITSIHIMKKRVLPKSQKCLRCGSCIEICPVGINPLQLKNPKYYELVKDKCLKCGLCSYICPVYINFNEYIKGEKN